MGDWILWDGNYAKFLDGYLSRPWFIAWSYGLPTILFYIKQNPLNTNLKNFIQ